MEAYYAQQAALPHFTGYYRQRGSGFGALAAGIGRFALPVATKFILPAAKKFGRELIAQAVPELLEVASKRKSPKQAIKSTVKKTVKKQLGGSMNKKRLQQSAVRARQKRMTNRPRKRRSVARTTKPARHLKRSRSDFFSNVKNVD